MTKKKEYALDIFRVLAEIDKGNFDFYQNLTEAEKKSFVPLNTYRWSLGNASSKERLLLLDGLVNTQVFSIYKHPDIIYKLLVACSDGKTKRYKWLPQKSKTMKSNVAIQIISKYYSCGMRDAEASLQNVTKESLLGMAEDMGEDKDVIAKIKRLKM